MSLINCSDRELQTTPRAQPRAPPEAYVIGNCDALEISFAPFLSLQVLIIISKHLNYFSVVFYGLLNGVWTFHNFEIQQYIRIQQLYLKPLHSSSHTQFSTKFHNSSISQWIRNQRSLVPHLLPTSSSAPPTTTRW